MSYPNTVTQTLDDDYLFKKGVVKALKQFKKLKTYQWPSNVRLAGMRILVNDVCKVYGVLPPKVSARNIDGSFSGASHYCRDDHHIVMVGKLSIITLLHELAHAIYGSSERQAVRWSVNLFRKAYPRQYAKLVADGHTLQST